jgi:hypothetical protein
VDVAIGAVGAERCHERVKIASRYVLRGKREHVCRRDRSGHRSTILRASQGSGRGLGRFEQKNTMMPPFTCSLPKWMWACVTGELKPALGQPEAERAGVSIEVEIERGSASGQDGRQNFLESGELGGEIRNTGPGTARDPAMRLVYHLHLVRARPGLARSSSAETLSISRFSSHSPCRLQGMRTRKAPVIIRRRPSISLNPTPWPDSSRRCTAMLQASSEVT